MAMGPFAAAEQLPALLLERLGVFGCSFTEAAAIHVCSAPPLTKDDVRRLLTRLLLAGSVQKVGGRGQAQRYQIWSDGEEGAKAGPNSEDRAVTLDRHLEWFRRYLGQLAAALRSERQDALLDQIQAEHENVRIALQWSMRPGADAALALELIVSSYRFWHVRNHLEEGLQWTLRALDLAGNRQDEIVLKAMNLAGLMSSATGDLRQSERLLRRVAGLASALDNGRAEAIALANLALTHAAMGKRRIALNEYQRALQHIRTLDEPATLAGVLCNYGSLLVQLRDFRGACAMLSEARETDLRIGDLWGLVNVEINIADMQFQEGDLDRAEETYCETLQNCVSGFSDTRSAAIILSSLAQVAVARASWTRAAILFGASAFAREVNKSELLPVEVEEALTSVAMCRGSLGNEEFDRIWAEGYAMDLDRAVAFAVGSLRGL